MVLSILVKLLGVVCVLLLIVNIVFLVKYGKPFITFQLPGIEELGGDEEEEGEDKEESELVRRRKIVDGKLNLLGNKPSLLVE